MGLKSLGIAAVGRIHRGQTAAEVIAACIAKAKLADTLGYSRFWIPEHHEAGSAWACSPPLMAVIGNSTTRIKVGSAAIILGLHHPIEIAEWFAFLCALLPNRVDCGLGGASADLSILGEYCPSAASDPHYLSKRFEADLLKLTRYLTKAYPAHHRLSSGVSPIEAAPPELWIMAVDGDKSRIAAERGTRLCYSNFHGRSQRDPDQIKRYFDDYQPSTLNPDPYAVIAVNVACAETSLEVQQLLSSIKVRPNVPPISGTADECLQQLEELAELFGITEIILKFEGSAPACRMRGCELLGEAFRGRRTTPS